MFYFFRFIHILIGTFFLLCLVYLYYSVLSNKVAFNIYLAFAAIILEGILLFVKGACPVTELQRKYGDKKGFFDLFLPEGFLPFVVPVFSLLTILIFIIYIFKIL